MRFRRIPCATSLSPSLSSPWESALPPTPSRAALSSPREEAQRGSDSIFPLYKSLLEGKDFLPPYGINLVLFDLSGKWDVKNFSAAVSGNEIASVSGSANVNPTTFGPRADLWLFPFMNVFVTGGGLKLNVQVTGQDIPLAVTKIPPQVIRGDVAFNLDFTGYYGGGGIVLMYAFQNIFVSGDYSAVWTHLESSTSGVEGNELRTDTASFRVGYNAGVDYPALYRSPLGQEDRPLRGNR